VAGVVLAFCQSSPICAVSHSSQLSVPRVALPRVDDVIPPRGGTAGGQRVVLLGASFVASPGVRVQVRENHGCAGLLCALTLLSSLAA
jgi:hypothetical protein